MTAQLSIIGRLGRDPQTTQLQSGSTMAFASVAVDRGYGENKKTIWFKVKCFGKLGERFAQHAKKGQLIFAAGEFDLDEYQDKAGHAKQAPVVTASNISWYGEKEAREHSAAIDGYNAKNRANSGAGYPEF